jgi:hypothetical protein
MEVEILPPEAETVKEAKSTVVEQVDTGSRDIQDDSKPLHFQEAPYPFPPDLSRLFYQSRDFCQESSGPDSLHINLPVFKLS